MGAELIIALDVPDADAALQVVGSLPSEVSFYKVGLELFSSAGPPVLQELRNRNKRIFLDLKLHDIPRTVERAVTSLTRYGVDLLTLHASGGRAMMQAAAKAAKGSGLRLIAVTTLTSLAEEDYADLGISRTLTAQALALGDLAIESGIDGLVTSAQEVGALRQHLGEGPLLVTPGIRPAGGDAGDQKRVATPEKAVRDGATHLVVGRPILQADDPAAAAREILAEIQAAG